MIYLNGSVKVIILEPGNVESIKNGMMESAQDGSTLIGYTPDVSYTSDELVKLIQSKPDGRVSIEEIQKIIKNSIERKEVKQRPYHPPLSFVKGGHGNS